MKKQYKKPVLIMESFQLDAAIAGGCGTPINHTVDTCGWNGNTGEVRAASDGSGGSYAYFGGACDNSVVNPETNQYDGTCYHSFGDVIASMNFLTS